MNRGSWVCFGVLLAILLAFTTAAFAVAARTPMWVDEIFAWNHAIQAPVAQTILHGAILEVSPAPLDFVVLRSLYVSRGWVGYFGLAPLQYFRVHYAPIMSLLVLGIYWVIVRRDKTVGGVLFLAALLPFLFHHAVFHFMSEMRAYGLWVALSLAMIFLMERAPDRPAAWIGLVTSLALTSTASVLQLLTALVSVIAARLLVDRRGIPALLRDPRFSGVLVGLGVGAYYASLAPARMSFSPIRELFLEHWLPFLPWLALGVVLFVHRVRRRDEAGAASCLTATGWLALGPVVYDLLLRRNYFFAPRQLLFMHAAVAFLTFEALRVGRETLRGRPVARRVAAVLAAAVLVTRLVSNAPPLGTILGRPSDPVGYAALEAAMAHGIPASYRLEKLAAIPPDWSQGWWGVDVLNHCAETALGIWWDYLTRVYPPETHPRAVGSTLVVRPYEAWGFCQAPCVGLELARIESSEDAAGEGTHERP